MLTSLLGPVESFNIQCTVEVFDDRRQLTFDFFGRLLVGRSARRSRYDYQRLPKSSGDDQPCVT